MSHRLSNARAIPARQVCGAERLAAPRGPARAVWAKGGARSTHAARLPAPMSASGSSPPPRTLGDGSVPSCVPPTARTRRAGACRTRTQIHNRRQKGGRQPGTGPKRPASPNRTADRLAPAGHRQRQRALAQLDDLRVDTRKASSPDSDAEPAIRQHAGPKPHHARWLGPAAWLAANFGGGRGAAVAAMTGAQDRVRATASRAPCRAGPRCAR